MNFYLDTLDYQLDSVKMGNVDRSGKIVVVIRGYDYAWSYSVLT